MKTSFLLGFLLLTAASVRAQDSPAAAPTKPAPAQQQPAAATDGWGTQVAPTAPQDQLDGGGAAAPTRAPDATATPATPAEPSGTDAAIGANTPMIGGSPSGAVKPLNPSPKLNPNSTGSYDKKVVKKQNKHSIKVVTKRRRATSRYAELRRSDQQHGIRRMDKGKMTSSALQR